MDVEQNESHKPATMQGKHMGKGLQSGCCSSDKQILDVLQLSIAIWNVSHDGSSMQTIYAPMACRGHSPALKTEHNANE